MQNMHHKSQNLPDPDIFTFDSKMSSRYAFALSFRRLEIRFQERLFCVNKKSSVDHDKHEYTKMQPEV